MGKTQNPFIPNGIVGPLSLKNVIKEDFFFMIIAFGQLVNIAVDLLVVVVVVLTVLLVTKESEKSQKNYIKSKLIWKLVLKKYSHEVKRA